MKMFRRITLLMLVAVLLAGAAPAEGFDVTAYTLEELKEIRELADQQIRELEIQDARENGDRSIDFPEDSLLLYLGKRQTLTARVTRRYETAPEKTVVLWESRDPAVAEVQEGVVTPRAQGETEIIAKAADNENIQAAVKVKVVSSISGFGLEQSEIELRLGTTMNLSTAQITARFQPENAYHRELIWTSSNENVVTVDPEGVLRAVSPGRAVISAQTKDPSLQQQKKASCTVTVVQTVTGIELDQQTVQLGLNKSIRLQADVQPENADNRNVEWESSDPAVATVSRYGVVTGKLSGECTITCRAADGTGVSDFCTVTVLRQITDIRDAADGDRRIGVKVGGEGTVSVRILPEDADRKDLQWSCSDPDVAEILQSDGQAVVIRGKKKGVATLTGQAEDGSGKSISYSVWVEDDCMLELTGVWKTGSAFGYRWFTVEFRNDSTARTIDGITLRYYAEDVYGEKIKSYGLGDYEVETTFNLTLKPGETRSSGQEIIYGFSQAKTIHAAVVKIHYTNGDIYEAEEPEYMTITME